MPEKLEELVRAALQSAQEAGELPAFDVTEADLVTAFVTEYGVLRPPFGPAFRKLFAEKDGKEG